MAVTEEERKRASNGGLTPYAPGYGARPTAPRPAAPAQPMVVAAPAPAMDMDPMGNSMGSAAPVPADQPMGYGAQMRNVGGAIADGAGAVLKTIVGAPGYGVNARSDDSAVAQPAPAAPAMATATMGAPSQVAQTDGRVNPTDNRIPLAGDVPAAGATPPVTAPGEGNMPGIPGVTKTVVDGRTSYSNTGGVESAPADVMGIYARAGAINKETAAIQSAQDQPGAMSNGSGAIILSGLTLQKDANNRFNGSPSLSTMNSGVSAVDQAQMANSRGIAELNAGVSRANNQESNETSRAGQMTSAESSRYGVDANARAAAGRLAVDSANSQANVAESNVRTATGADTLKARRDYAAALKSGDPKAVEAAENNLRAVQGKYEKETADNFTVTPIPAGVDPATGMPRGAGAIKLNRKTGETTVISPDAAKGTSAAPAYEAGKVYQDAKGNKAQWNGKEFVKI